MGASISTMLTAYILTIIVSMAVAVMIKAMTVMLGKMHSGQAPTPVARPATPVAAQAAAPAGAAGGEIAAIAAAVYAALGAHVRIVRIEDSERGALWTAGGRMVHHQSHALVRRQPVRAP